LHIDLDVFDPEEAPSNEYATADGLSVEQVSEVIKFIQENFEINSTTIASYDPQLDSQGKTLNACFRLIKQVLAF
jgi:arginase family enzyme